MADDRNIDRYLRSKVFRTCSWLSAAFIVTFFLAPSHRVWFIYAAAAVSFCAMLPILRVVPYSQNRYDISFRPDRQSLI
ncbi:MAG TPA: hypothetical protein VFA90_19290 [Terriglobales bacterium]|nr:hypothetical protein [Terriglobales bacterium]